jgi:hypothetical protein
MLPRRAERDKRDVARSRLIVISIISNSQDSIRFKVVIASEAKQSISPSKERMDCFVASLLAMTLR